MKEIKTAPWDLHDDTDCMTNSAHESEHKLKPFSLQSQSKEFAAVQ